MIQSKFNQWKTVLRRRVCSTLLVAIIALTIAVPLVVPVTETDSAQDETLSGNKSWNGDFDEMAVK